MSLKSCLIDAIDQTLVDYPSAPLAVAFSGGLDSAALLYCAQLWAQENQRTLRVLHVNHRLHANVVQWPKQAMALAESYGLPCKVLTVLGQCPAGQSLEAWARTERYSLLSEALVSDECLLLAHHRQDQAETFILQALRGAGNAGLSAMPAVRQLGQGLMLRPWLGISQEQLQAFAQEQALSWVDDPSNVDTQFDRNYLRHIIWPHVIQRWPSAEKTLSRAAQCAGESDSLSRALAEALIDVHTFEHPCEFPVSALLGLPQFAQAYAVQVWLKRCGWLTLTFAQCQAILTDVVDAKEDAMPEFCQENRAVRRYRQCLYALTEADCALPEHRYYQWDPSLPLVCAKGRIVLHAQKLAVLDCSLSELLDNTGCIPVHFNLPNQTKVRWGQGRKSLKQFFQDQGIAPWVRGSVPVLEDHSGEFWPLD